MIAPVCPYCRQPAALHHTRWGWKWECLPCEAWVGTHANSQDHAPLGRLANAELRAWKMRAHDAFDPLWKDGGPLKRGEAYAILRGRLGLTAAQAHIGMFDVDQCKRVVAAFGGSTDRSEQALKKDEGRDRVVPNPALGDQSRQAVAVQKPRSSLRSMDLPPVDMRGAITGKQYKPLPCACDALPWTICTGCIPQAQWLAGRAAA